VAPVADTWEMAMKSANDLAAMFGNRYTVKKEQGVWVFLAARFDGGK
jgi:hypothetical protein